MNILLEGVDRSGKTTLTSKLFEHYSSAISEVGVVGVSKFHFGVPRGNSFDEHCDMLFNTLIPNLLSDTEKPMLCIFDRYIHADLIYGPLYRNKLDVTLDKLLFLEIYLNMLRSVLINTEIPIDYNYSLLVDEGENKVNYSQLTTLRTGIHELIAKESIIPNVTYDYTENSITELIKFIDDNIFGYASTQSFDMLTANMPRKLSQAPDVIFLLDAAPKNGIYYTFGEIGHVMQYIILNNYKRSNYMITHKQKLFDPSYTAIGDYEYNVITKAVTESRKIIKV